LGLSYISSEKTRVSSSSARINWLKKQAKKKTVNLKLKFDKTDISGKIGFLFAQVPVILNTEIAKAQRVDAVTLADAVTNPPSNMIKKKHIVPITVLFQDSCAGVLKRTCQHGQRAMAQAQQLLRHTLPQAILRVISSSQDIKSGSSQDTQSQTLYSIIEYISELICMETESGAREMRRSDPVQLELLNEHTTEALGSDSTARQLLSAFARLYAKTDLQPWWLTRQ